MTGLTANTELVVCSAETLATHPELFHYTSLAAFQSIVTSNSFWASHYADMADKSEVILMKDKLHCVIAPRFEEIVAPMNRPNRRLFQAAGGGLGVAKDFVGSLYGATFFGKAAFSALEAFLVSFSTHAHDSDVERAHGAASQSQGYAGPNGVCLVLDTASMAEYLGQAMDSQY